MTDIKQQFRAVSREECFLRMIDELNDRVVLAMVGIDNALSAKRPEDTRRLLIETQHAMNSIPE